MRWLFEIPNYVSMLLEIKKYERKLLEILY